MQDEKLLTVPETAAALRCHENTVRRWLLTGQMAGKKAGRKWLVPEASIDAFMRDSQPKIDTLNVNLTDFEITAGHSLKAD